jgi:hypothetical protein
MNGKDRYGMKS